MEIANILKGNNTQAKKSLFLFDSTNSNEQVLFKFNIWSRYFFPQYFKSPDASFHKDIDGGNLQAYRGAITQFVDIAFRGAAKTARTKLFIAYVIANDLEHLHRYFRILSAELDNAKQTSTDIYNMLITIRPMYPDIFEETEKKREETMGSFTTATGVKMLAKQVGVDQRGNIMEDAKADFDWYDDFETRTTLYSALKGKKIWDNMEEARTGLAQGGASIYTCNYISERGNVHTLVTKPSSSKLVLNVPIYNEQTLQPTWERYTMAEIEKMKIDDDDFWGERMGKPSASKDAYFDRESLDKMPVLQPIRTIGEFKIFKEYNPSHSYAGGHDIAGGLGLDSSTSVFIDFSTIPAQVVGTFASNTILPEAFGDEIYSQSNRFGGCLIAPENNKYDQTILKARQLGAKLYSQIKNAIRIIAVLPSTYGWNTNSLTKSKMFSDLREAVESGLLELNDIDLINEAKGYSRNDILDHVADVRLVTRHFDLLTACSIAWQMKDEARPAKPKVSNLVTNEKETNIAI